MPTPAEIKKALLDAGFEVYRTRGDVVFVAERVRENLLMDAGIYVRAQSAVVGFVVRAQRTDFPNEPESALFDRARKLAVSAVDRGFVEALVEARRLADPGDPDRTLDTWCEIAFEKEAQDITGAIDEVRFATTLEKAAAPR